MQEFGDAGRALRLQVGQGGAERDLLALGGRRDHRAARVLSCLRDKVGLLPVEHELGRLRLEDGRRAPLNAHGDAAAVGQPAAGSDLRIERIVGHAHRAGGLGFVDPRLG